MGDKHLIIVGGGLAGLAAGCYARRSGLRTTIVEHHGELGGVCAAWHRGDYVIDGCIQWLTGGPFQRLYEELGIMPAVPVRTLDVWTTYRHRRDRFEVPFTRDLEALIRRLVDLSPADAPELDRIRRGAAEFSAIEPPLAPSELAGLGDTLRSLWDLRGAAGTMVHFRKPVGLWAREHLHSARLQRLFTRVMPESAPALFLLMVLGYLERGYLSRPVGGTAAFRDALVARYRALGGEVRLGATVDEILVGQGRATGVRLADGTLLAADAVLSTASAPETVLRLLGGAHDADATRERLARWQLFEPIVLASFGVARPYAAAPSLLLVDGIEPLEIGQTVSDRLGVRVCNDDPSFAPPGHTVVQATVATDYDFWATRGDAYASEKQFAADAVLGALEPDFPDIVSAVRMTDVATPLTFWRLARSWRGAYEGWMPRGESLFAHMRKKLSGLEGFYMAGQWVEPGGGVPTAVMSGRQAIELLCADLGRPFVA
jgi:phytoene dehydrogenase-like protein